MYRLGIYLEQFFTYHPFIDNINYCLVDIFITITTISLLFNLINSWSVASLT
jgi:hypothetical protein